MRIKKFLLASLTAFQFSGCAETQIPSSKLYPISRPDEAQAATPQGAWTSLRTGKMATIKAKMANVGGYLVAHIDIQNTASEAPLQISKVIAYDKDKTLLKTEHSSNISEKMEGEAARNQAAASGAANNANASLREARIIQAVNSRGAWGASLGEGLASAITANIYGARAAEFKSHAEFIYTNGYQNNPIPNGFSNRGLISFFVSDRVPPYTLEIELTNRDSEETFSFTFGGFDLEAFWTVVPQGREDLRNYWSLLSHDDRKVAVAAAKSLWADKEKFNRLKAADPNRAAIVEWIHKDWVVYQEFNIAP